MVSAPPASVRHFVVHARKAILGAARPHTFSLLSQLTVHT